MVWSEDKFIAFFHNPKTAGWSIMTVLKDKHGFDKNMYRHGGPKKIEKLVKLHKFKTFAVVRNPFDRLLSWYYHMIFTILDIRNREIVLDKEQYELLLSCFTFKNFVLNAHWIYRDHGQVKLNFRQSQLDFLKNRKGDLPDYILRYENLDEDWEKFCKNVDLEYYPLPKLNVSRVPIEDYRYYYDDEMVEIVTKRYQDDIDYFGYTYE